MLKRNSPASNANAIAFQSWFGPNAERPLCWVLGQVGIKEDNVSSVRIATFVDLGHRVPFELVTGIARTHHGLLASKLGKKASANLAAIQIDQSSLRT